MLPDPSPEIYGHRRDGGHKGPPAPHIPDDPAEDPGATAHRHLYAVMSTVVEHGGELAALREDVEMAGHVPELLAHTVARLDALADRLTYLEAGLHHVLDTLKIDPHRVPDPFDPHHYGRPEADRD